MRRAEWFYKYATDIKTVFVIFVIPAVINIPDFSCDCLKTLRMSVNFSLRFSGKNTYAFYMVAVVVSNQNMTDVRKPQPYALHSVFKFPTRQPVIDNYPLSFHIYINTITFTTATKRTNPHFYLCLSTNYF